MKIKGTDPFTMIDSIVTLAVATTLIAPMSGYDFYMYQKYQTLVIPPIPEDIAHRMSLNLALLDMMRNG